LTLSLKRSQPAPGEEDEFRRRFVSDPPTDKERDAADAAITRLRRHNYPPHESNTEVDEGTSPRDDPNIVDTAEAILAARAILSRVPPAERTIVVKALEESLTGGAAGGEGAGTDDPATVELRADVSVQVEPPSPETATPGEVAEAAAETTERGRPKWKSDLGLTAAQFAAQAYAAEFASGTFDKSVIRQDDITLYNRLYREKAWGELAALTEAHVPTKPERNSQRLIELAERGEQPSRSDDIGLYEAGRYRSKQHGQDLKR
jgi:hypothetical protein